MTERLEIARAWRAAYDKWLNAYAADEVEKARRWCNVAAMHCASYQIKFFCATYQSAEDEMRQILKENP
jgi:hypothetical protein